MSAQTSNPQRQGREPAQKPVDGPRAVVAQGDAPPESSSHLEAAIDYARNGIPVFPCEPAGKRPLTSRGLHDATTDLGTIERRWGAWPSANIGSPVPEDQVVVDIDGKEGLEALERSGHVLPPTRVVRTGRGWHHYYSTSCPIRSRTSILPKVDIKGHGGYVLLPPSLHANGRLYECVEEGPLVAAPDWIYRVSSSTSRGRERLDVAATLEGVPEGSRDIELFRLASRLRREGVRSPRPRVLPRDPGE